MSKTIGKKARNRIIILEFMVPALIILTVFVFYPILKSIVMSFQNWHLTSSSKEHEWVGLKNYKDVFEISHFWQMIGTTLLYTFFSVAGKMFVGLGVALLFNKQFKGRSIVRGIMLIPWAMPTVVVCNTILIATDPDYGILTALFRWLFQLTNLQIFSSTTSSLVAVIIVNIWKNFLFVSLMLLSALSTIPKDYYDAASIDGAGAFAQYRNVTWPQLKGIWNTLLILEILWTIKEFELVYLITKGGPNNATNIIGIDIYLNAFKYYKVGMASAEGVLLLLVCLVFSIIYFRKVNEEE